MVPCPQEKQLAVTHTTQTRQSFDCAQDKPVRGVVGVLLDIATVAHRQPVAHGVVGVAVYFIAGIRHPGEPVQRIVVVGDNTDGGHDGSGRCRRAKVLLGSAVPGHVHPAAGRLSQAVAGPVEHAGSPVVGSIGSQAAHVLGDDYDGGQRVGPIDAGATDGGGTGERRAQGRHLPLELDLFPAQGHPALQAELHCCF